MSSTGPSNKSHKSRYVALGAVSALGLLALGGQSVSANSVVVKPGDTVWGIANQYATTKSALETANPNSIKKISNSIDLIQAGQSLVLPNTGNAQVAQTSNQTNTYVVKRGDTLSAIAKKFDVTVNQLMAWNHLTNADRIQVGQVLIVSGDPNASVPVTNAAASATAAPAPAATTNTTTTTTTVTSAVSAQPAATPVANQPAATPVANQTAASGQNAGAAQTQPAANNSVNETASTRAVYAAYTRTSYQPTSQAQTTQVSAAVAQPTSANTQQPVSQATTQTTQTTTQQVPVNNNTTNTTSAATNGQAVVVNNQTSQAANTQVNQQSQASSQATVNVVPAQSSASQPVSSAATVQSSSAAQNNQAAQNTQNQNNNTNGGVIFVDNNSQTTPAQSSNTGSVVSLAVKLANSNIPYVWGGNSLSGMDCSGLVDYVYLHATGKQLPHYTVALENCVYQKPVSQAQAGDLLFWGSHGSTYHTAIYIGNNQYVAAPEPGENVQVQTISQYFMPSFAGTVK